MEQVHIAITRQVRHGTEAAFAAALKEFARRSLHFAGTTGVHLIGPIPDSGSNEFGILRSFEGEAACEAFYASDLYRNWQEQVVPLVEGVPIKRRLHGLEAFFRGFDGAPPARWKMAVVTWIGVFPTVWLWTWLLSGLLNGPHPVAGMAIADVFIVITLAWIAMPLLTRAFAGWLNQTPKPMRKNKWNQTLSFTVEKSRR